jgi:cyclase
MYRSGTMDVRTNPRRRGLVLVGPPLTFISGLLAFALAALGGATASSAPEAPCTVSRLSSRVIVLDCLNVNVTAISTDSGIVVIDTNRNPCVMQRLRTVIEKEFGRQEFVYLVNTHGDPDHASGNQAFPSVPLIAHQDYGAFLLHGRAARLREDWTRRSRLEDVRSEFGASDRESLEAGEIRGKVSARKSMSEEFCDERAARLPTVTFKDSLQLNLGDLTLELRFCGEAHTNHDIVVYVPEEKLLLVGDLICSPESPCFPIDAMADVPRLVRELAGLLERRTGLETVVPGHGRILARADLSSFYRTISERFGTIRTETSAARIVSQAVETEGILPARDLCPLPAADGPGAVYWSEEEFARLGERLIRRGKGDEALSVLQLAVGALPGSTLLYGSLGDAWLEMDKREEAAAAYERALALAPENRRAAEMLEILRHR